ncbi:MAG: HNH endonuclease [Armatimonadetes bacterium]|nr:HNH endonuclease [Armatimonadota bacterium]
MRLTVDQHAEVRRRANRLCEYCGWPDWFSPDPFAIDHIYPASRGGSDGLENRAYCCGGCNGAKYDCIEAPDPTTGQPAPLFHPRQDSWEDHFTWNADQTEMIGITPTGRATIARLRLNREEVVRLRRVLPLLPRPTDSGG